MVNDDRSKIDISAFFLSISSSAMLGLGFGSGPAGEHRGKADLDLVKQNIELLELLKEKTKGNLTPEEDGLLGKLLFEIRMRFVEASKAKLSG